MSNKKALIVVDMQNDFMPGGSLPVPKGDSIISKIKEVIDKGGYSIVVFSQDWHVKNHSSFKEYGGLWASHCIGNTIGAEVVDELDSYATIKIKKGTFQVKDSYSAFCSDGESPNKLGSLLEKSGISEVHVCGVAFEYCVKETAMDSVKRFKTVVLKDSTAGISKDGIEQAEIEMKEKGIEVI